MDLQAVREDGSVVKPGEMITLRGSHQSHKFIKCVSATIPGKSGKVLVADGTEYGRTLYAHIFGLRVEVVR